MKKLLATLLLVFAGSAQAQSTVYPYFGPGPSGLVKSNGTAVLQSAAATDVSGLWSGTCNSHYYLSGAGTCLADFGDIISIRDFGAKLNVLSLANCSITSGANSLNCPTATFTAGDVGKTVIITGAAGSLNSLATTISGFTNSTTVTTTANASATTPFSYAQGVSLEPAPGTGYVPGDTVTLTGGTFTTATVLTVRSTQVVSAAINAAGSGAIGGVCTVFGTTGTGAKFNATVNIVAGAISSITAVANPGYYTTNPTLTGESVTSNCGLVGGTLNLTMGTNVMAVTTAGVYSVAPTSPVSQGSTSGSGSGATFNMSYLTAGAVTYGTDDTAAFNSAIAAINTAFTSGSANRPCLFVPAGGTLIGSNPTAFAQGVPGCVLGTGGDLHSVIYISPAVSGDIFQWSEAWFLNAFPFNGITLGLSSQQAGPLVYGISIIGDRTASGDITLFHFYDRNDFIHMDRVDASTIKGQFIKTGDQKNTTQSFIREAYFGPMRCYQCGDTGKAAVEFYASGTGTGGTPVDIENLNIYAPYGDGLYMHSDATGTPMRGYHFKHLRIEGIENNSPGISAHLLHIGNSAQLGTINGVHILDAQLIGPYFGNYAFLLDGASVAAAPYDIHFEGTFSGQTAEGGGVDVNACRACYFLIDSMFTASTNITVAPSTRVGFPVEFNGAGMETTWTSSIDSTSVASVVSPATTLIPTLGPDFTSAYAANSFSFNAPRLSGPSWTTKGLVLGALASIALTDTTATGTVANEASAAIPQATVSSTNAGVTYTQYASLYLPTPLAGTNVTITTPLSLLTQGEIISGGLIQGNLGLATFGANSSINKNSNFTTEIGDGSTTGTVTIGGGSDAVTLNATTLTENGTVNINANNNAATNLGTGSTTSTVTLGGGSDAVTINATTATVTSSTAVNINTSAGTATTGIGTGTTSGTVTVGGGSNNVTLNAATLTEVGTSATINASSGTNTVSIGTGSTTGTVTVGGGSNAVTLNATTLTANGTTTNVNVSANNPTNINTGTSTGTVSIGSGTGNNTVNIGNGTGTTSIGDILKLVVGTATVEPLLFQSGTNLTTPAAGAVEYDGVVPYFTPSSSSREVLLPEAYEIISSAYTLTSQTGAQKLLNGTTNGTITVPVGTFEFECQFSLSSLSTTATFGFALGGTATFTQGWWATTDVPTGLAATGTASMTYNTAANTAISSTASSGFGVATISGVVRVTVAGTIIPQVSMSVAAAAVVGTNSFCRFRPVGASGVVSIGNWS